MLILVVIFSCGYEKKAHMKKKNGKFILLELFLSFLQII